MRAETPSCQAEGPSIWLKNQRQAIAATTENQFLTEVRVVAIVVVVV
jgi:hypothetical protein